MDNGKTMNSMSFQRLRRSCLRKFVTLAVLGATVPSLFGAGPYRYYRFVPTFLRDTASADSVQIAEFQLLANGTRLSGAIASNPGGSSPSNESPAQGNDNSLSTKWLDFTKFTPLVLDFGAPVTANGYRLATANDSQERDPVSWRVEGSTDNVNWIILDTQTSYPVPTARQTYLPNFSLTVVAGPTIAFSASPSPILAGGSSTLTWLVTGADAGTIRIEPGIGVVTPNDTRSVSPTATTTYTLTAAGGGITATSRVTVAVAIGALNVSTYDSLEGDHLLAPLSNLINAAPSATALQIDTIDYNNNFVGNLPGLTGRDSFAVLWTGWFDVSKDGPGDYTFGTQSDDGSVIYIDLDDDGDFDDAGELIVDNRGIHPVSTRTGTVNLTRDFVRFALGFYESGGNEAIRGGFKKGSSLGFGSLDPINGITGHFQPTQPAAGFPTITFASSPSAIQPGQSATLSWTVANATSIRIDNGIGVVSANGTRAVSPGNTTTYSLTASNALGTRTKTATVTVVAAGSFRYYRFQPTALRDEGGANSVQIAEFQMLLGGVRLAGAVASNPGGQNPGGESPQEANDNDLNTKWLDFTKFNPLVLDFGSPAAANGYRIATANDSEERDPVSWTVDGSHDGSSWVTLDTQTAYPTPEARNAYLPDFTLRQIEPPRITNVRFDGAFGIVTLEWTSNPGEFYDIDSTPDLSDPGNWFPVVGTIPAAAVGNRTSYDVFLFLPGPPEEFFRVVRGR